MFFKIIAKYVVISFNPDCRFEPDIRHIPLIEQDIAIGNGQAIFTR